MISTISADLYTMEDEGESWLDTDEYDALALPDLDENCNPLPYERHQSKSMEQDAQAAVGLGGAV